MERIVIVAYKANSGKEMELEALLTKHWSRLDAIGMVSERKPVIARAEDGTFIEVFGWKSSRAIREAHGHPDVQVMWEEFALVCNYVPVGNIEESMNLFSEFTPV